MSDRTTYARQQTAREGICANDPAAALTTGLAAWESCELTGDPIMYANLIQFKLGPGKCAVAEQVMKGTAPAIGQRPGFRKATFLGNDEQGQYGALEVFASKEDAEAAFQALFPQFRAKVKDVVVEPHSRTLFEVLEPVG